MIRSCLLLLALSAPAAAQVVFTYTGPPPADAPRAVEAFAGQQGYADMAPDRFGTPAMPVQSSLGLYLIARMIQNTCLGLEQGAALDDVTPEGFAPYPVGPYSLAQSPAPEQTDGHIVLSSTGSVDLDEEQGHTTIWLNPQDTGMRCQVEWHLAEDLTERQQENMSIFLTDWVPYQFALVRATRPMMDRRLMRRDMMEWDRMCGDRWCGFEVRYEFPSGPIVLSTTLNITSIQGTRP